MWQTPGVPYVVKQEHFKLVPETSHKHPNYPHNLPEFNKRNYPRVCNRIFTLNYDKVFCLGYRTRMYRRPFLRLLPESFSVKRPYVADLPAWVSAYDIYSYKAARMPHQFQDQRILEDNSARKKYWGSFNPILQVGNNVANVCSPDGSSVGSWRFYHIYGWNGRGPRFPINNLRFNAVDGFRPSQPSHANLYTQARYKRRQLIRENRPDLRKDEWYFKDLK